MFGAIIWVVVVIWIVATVSKNKKQQGQKQQKPVQSVQQKAVPKNQNSDAGQTGNLGSAIDHQRATLERLQKKYNRQPEESILDRAKASVEQRFAEPQAVHSDSNARVLESSSTHKVSERNRREERKPLDSRELPQAAAEEQSDIMKQIENLMVAGPDTSVEFGRDFLAEGMDMLNRIQGI